MLPTRSLTKMVHLALYDASAAMDVSEKYKSWSVRASPTPGPIKSLHVANVPYDPKEFSHSSLKNVFHKRGDDGSKETYFTSRCSCSGLGGAMKC